MSGICVAVNATTWKSVLWRNTTLKLWKSRPAAPRIRTFRMAHSSFRKAQLATSDLQPPMGQPAVRRVTGRCEQGHEKCVPALQESATKSRFCAEDPRLLLLA